MQRIRATALVVKDEKVLLMHRFKNEEEYWVLPGGSVEEEEDIQTAVLRELKEETSIEARVKQKLVELELPSKERHAIYLCEYISGEPLLGKESVETGRSGVNNSYSPEWVNIDKLPTLVLYPKEIKEFLLTNILTNLRM